MGYLSNQGPPTVVVITTTTNAGPVQQQYPSYPSQQQYPPPPPIMSAQNSGWRNKPQTDATAAGGLIFLSAGMNLALGVGWSQYSYFGRSIEHFRYAWFLGVIIGSVFSIPLRYLISKRLLMAISSALIIFGGITYVCQPFDKDYLLAGRYFNGIAIGLVIVPFLMYASEIATDSYRGACLATEQYSISCGIALQMIYTSYWSEDNDFPVNRLHGIFDIIFGILAAVSLKYFIESPIDSISKGNESTALESLALLQRPQGVTTETIALWDQCKAYVREEQSLSLVNNIANGFLPLLKMLLFRSMMLAFCSSLHMNMTFHLSMREEWTEWAPWLAATLRMLGSLTALIFIDKNGRKLPSLLAMAILGGLTLAHAQRFHSYVDFPGSNDIATAKNLFLPIQFFAGFFAPYASVYIGEAFPLKLKPFLMDICILVEQLVHITIIIVKVPVLIDSLSAQGGLMVGAFVILCLLLPETRNTSLSEAQRRFRKFLYLKFK